ncbi:hypothetical protein QOT17_016787 [Balamuthia mandrillaris]
MFSELPFELQVECLKWLGGSPAADWLHCCLTSKSMSELCHDAALWHFFCCQQGLLPGDTEEAVTDWKQHYFNTRTHLELFEDTMPGTFLLSPSKLNVRKTSPSQSHVSCRSSHRWTSGRHYFEVSIKHTNNQVFIGIAEAERAATYASIAGFGRNPGWSVRPYVGEILDRRGRQAAAPKTRICFSDGDTIGVYLDIDAGDLYYFLNGSYLVGLQDCGDLRDRKPYYASVSLMFEGEEVTFRFPASIPSFVKEHIEERYTSG